MSLLDDIPTVLLFIIFITVIPFLSVLGMYVFKKVGITDYTCGDFNVLVGIFITVVSVFLGILISFLIVTVWNSYTEAQLNSEREAEQLYTLYSTVFALPNTENIQDLIIEYTEYVINVEYAFNNQGSHVLAGGADILREIQLAIYNYVPEGGHNELLYQQALTELNAVIDLRVSRIDHGTSSVGIMLWIVTILDSILIIIMTWFLQCDAVLHYVLVIIIAIYVASGLFIIFTLSHPYQGSQSVTPDPYQIALSNMLKL